MIMKCPFLEEIMVAYCTACKVKKMLPKDDLALQNPCEVDYRDCPIYQEFLSGQKKERKMAYVDKHEVTMSGKEKPCIWMKAGVIAYRMCTKEYDCKNCEFDQALMDQSGTYTESPLVVQAIEKLRRLPATERKCRYMLTGDFTYKICANNYECWHCEVDQYVQDTIEASPYMQKRKQRMAKQEKKVKGFAMREDYSYLPNHIWIKTEGDVIKIGIDSFAARLIGRIEKIDFADKGIVVENEKCWSLGGPNRLARMSLPVNAEIVERNEAVQSDPTLVQRDPYNRGWLLKVKPSGDISHGMKGAQAIEWLEKEFEKLHEEFEESIGVTITDGGELVEDVHERLTDEEWSKLVEQFLS
jgi:glycine cleavage system H lipoate-binding protein